ncbi:murein biosynthesis integral membrane protein MurJ [Candidatus Saccharibacteria bacterium]|nr:murein biosynthesis integral membrane protein MurJ [Candidatus Saccharibacteria bacterium]
MIIRLRKPENPFHYLGKLTNYKLSIKSAAVILAVSTLLAAILGLLRDRILNSMYLSTYPTGIDAYTAAFMIPDFMYFVLVSGALNVTFIPVLNEHLVKKHKKSAWELSSSIINLLAIVTLVVSVLIIIFAAPLVKYVISPGLSESGQALAVSMMRVIAINPFLFSIATIMTSMQQATGRFIFYALAPAIYNVGIIIGTLFFTNGITIFGWHIFGGGIMGVALGVALGSVMQFLVSIIGLFGMGFDYKFKIKWRDKSFRRVLKLIPARSLDQGTDYVNGIVEVNLSSRMAAGTVRSYQQALNFHSMPVNLIGVAISTAFFPKMTESVGENREDKFKNDLRASLRMIVWLALPVAIMVFFTRGYLVSFIKNGGDVLIAGLLGALVVSIFFRSVFQIVSRGFYAHQDTRTPFIVSIISIGLSISLAIYFSMVLHFGPYGLAYGQSIGAVVEVSILVFILNHRLNGIFSPALVRAFLKIFVAAIIAGIVTYIATLIWPLRATDQSIFVTFPKFVLICLFGGLAYIAAGLTLHLKENADVIQHTIKLLSKTIRHGKHS